MPHINRIRVNNVKYNFGTQAYEDFLLKPFGHNMLYDLANGGGKSVLMLLMLQTVLPNCSLDEKQPVEKLFRTADGSQTIHSLIEWKLDEGDIINGFRYMTTGFCARKAQNSEEGARETASIEYFNYCIFYRDYNANDIRNLPLVKKKEKITYTGLKRYLKELERDNSLIVRVFDRKGEYQAFIADYGLYESEWEIIRGINKTEGHVRTYFESNYKTTRKVIEDLLIEEIIQKSFRAKGGQDSEDTMSKTLLDMKDKLVELSRKKTEISNFDRQMELLEMFAGRIDSLREVYDRMTALRQEIAALYQAAGYFEQECTQQAEETETKLKQTELSIRELHERIDTARYMEDRTKVRKLEQEMKRLQKETEEEKTALEHAFRQLALRESMNDYLEYAEEKAGRDETVVELEAMKSEKGSLLAELQFLTFYMKKEIVSRQKELEGELNVLETRYNSLRIRRRSVDEKERELSQEIAVRKSRIEEAEKSRNEISERLSESRRKVGLLLLEESGKQKETDEQELQKQKKTELTLKEQMDFLQKNIAANEKKLLECSISRKQLSQEEELNTDFFTAYEEQKKRADRLLEVYGARDYEKLAEEIRERELQARTRLTRLADEIRSLKQRLSAFSEEAWGGFLDELPNAQELKEYIAVRHSRKVQTGKEYLAGCGEEQRKTLLQEYPYLPYALVVDGGIRQLREDSKLRDGEGGCPIYPIIKEAALRNGRELTNPEDMSLFSRDFGIFLQEGAADKEKGRFSALLSDLEYQKKRLEDQKATYQEDEHSLAYFLYCYEEKYQENRRKREEREKKLHLLKEQEQDCQAEDRRLRLQLEEVYRQQQRTADRIEELCRDIVVLQQIEIDFAEQEKLEKQLAGEQEQKQLLEQEREKQLSQMKDMENESEETAARKNAVRIRLERLTAQWKEKYQIYDVPGDYGECSLRGDALEAELNGKRQAYEKEHSQADDKNRLLQSYISAMNRSLRAISNRGISLSLLKGMEENNELYATDEKELAGMREENARAETALAKKKRELERITGEWNRLHGKTGQLAAELNERYGSTPELSLQVEDVEEYIENHRSRIDRLAKQAEELKARRKELYGEALLFTDMKKDIERMSRSSRLRLPEGGAVIGEPERAAVLKERFAQAETEYDRLEDERKKRREEFSRNRQKVIDTLVLLDAAPLAQEMKESLQMPEDEAETVQMVKNLYEVRECLALEKSRVERGIEDIISLKDNFENQCLQRCINIRTELDRLPKLSKITLNGEQIPMISLQIPYVKEEFYKERMSGYIDEIVANVDDFHEQNERLKYIRSALSFKKLFSVIVTDMNAIRLSLYKRERIREQSRHLRYEEAVGSTGQSQGIYIQFLIAVINYISNINSGKGENTGLGKVIFIDNPFGAAKDIYIWEPIFELLRTNQVQLIVPARGTTPAITGRFDVNYILGQKLTDGKQQTVVVDYHSSVETEEMEYIPLQYEQESFDFSELI